MNTLHRSEASDRGPATDGGQARLRQALVQATLGAFEVFGEIGRGGMATVFLGYDLALERYVAIKVMAPGLLLQEGMAERFGREARIAAGLSHPHIIPVYAVTRTDELAFFVMKYVEGCTLDTLIREHAPLPPSLASRILVQVAAALAYAHRRGVVHRDIKPANILVDADGDAVVTDFGIARAEWLPGLTATGASVGTPYYMSPEQCSGGDVTGLSDQYSLGVVAYQMLVGRLPFPRPDATGVIQAHLTEPVPDLIALRPDCPPHLGNVVMRMLAKAPELRWPDMHAVAEATRGNEALLGLEEARDRLATLVRTAPGRTVIPDAPVSPTPITRAGPFGGLRQPRAGFRLRHRLAAGALLLVLATGAVWLTNLRPAADRETAPPVPTVIVPDTQAAAAATDLVGASIDESSDPGRRTPTDPGRLAERPRPQLPQEDKARVPGPSAPPEVQPPPSNPEPTVPQWGWVLIGTRHENAFLYINGVPQLPKAPSLRWWRVPAGDLILAFHAEGCTPWEETRTLVPGDSIRIGFRFPTCPNPQR